jgi:hypothetical protein
MAGIEPTIFSYRGQMFYNVVVTQDFGMASRNTKNLLLLKTQKSRKSESFCIFEGVAQWSSHLPE